MMVVKQAHSRDGEHELRAVSIVANLDRLGRASNNGAYNFVQMKCYGDIDHDCDAEVLVSEAWIHDQLASLGVGMP